MRARIDELSRPILVRCDFDRTETSDAVPSATLIRSCFARPRRPVTFTYIHIFHNVEKRRGVIPAGSRPEINCYLGFYQSVSIGENSISTIARNISSDLIILNDVCIYTYYIHIDICSLLFYDLSYGIFGGTIHPTIIFFPQLSRYNYYLMNNMLFSNSI